MFDEIRELHAVQEVDQPCTGSNWATNCCYYYYYSYSYSYYYYYYYYSYYYHYSDTAVAMSVDLGPS